MAQRALTGAMMALLTLPVAWSQSTNANSRVQDDGRPPRSVYERNQIDAALSKQIDGLTAQLKSGSLPEDQRRRTLRTRALIYATSGRVGLAKADVVA